jgi:hypothetical protein
MKLIQNFRNIPYCNKLILILTLQSKVYQEMIVVNLIDEDNHREIIFRASKFAKRLSSH